MRLVARRKSNVHEIASSFVGRERERAALAERFEQGARLVTLVGPGGIGKTRIATRFAVERIESFSAHGGGGAWFCDVTDARSATAVAAVVAASLGIVLKKSAAEAAVVEELGETLARRRRMLIVFDNFEHVAHAAAASVGVWLARAPEIVFLVTSRVPLGVPGEEVWPLEPLALPPAADAVELFLARARAARPELGPDAPALAAEIALRLDGLPLAIELAAARARVLSLAQIRDRLEKPLDLLVRTNDAGRHASMRTAVLDSVRLLDDASRAFFAGCAVFRGGFTLELADAVLGREGVSVLPLVETLVAHSLLRAVSVPELGFDVRYAFFEAIGEVARELLAEREDRASLAAAHARAVTERGSALAAEAVATGSAEALSRLGHELENLVVAHAHAIAEPPSLASATLALRVALALEPFTVMRGLFRLRLRLLDAAIGAAAAAGHAPRELADAHLARGHARRELGDLASAREDFERGRVEAGAATDLVALADLRLGELVETSGATAEARALYGAARDALRTAPESATRRAREAEALLRLGHAFRREGDLARAEREIEGALVLYRAAAHDEGLALALYEAGVIALLRARYDDARTFLDEGLALARSRGARQAEGALLAGRGILLQETNDIEGAIAQHAEAAQAFREVQNPHREGSALYYLAGAYLERGDVRSAEPILARALEHMKRVGVPRYEALIEGARAVVLARSGRLAAARDALAAADAAAAACQSEATLLATLAIHRASVDHAASPNERAAADVVRLAEPHASDDVRFALRLFRRAAGPRASVAAPLVVYGDARAFLAPGASERVDLTRRRPLRRVLDALVERRIASPGEALSLDDVLAAGWPGERVGYEAAANRVYVALATLRKLGLRDLVASTDAGYLIPPTQAIERRPDEGGPEPA